MRHKLIAGALGVSLILSGLSLPATAFAAEDLPAAVERLGLTDIHVHPKRSEHHGRVVEGRLPDGARIEIELDRHGNVEEVEAKGRGGFPARAVEGLVPEAVRANAAYPADATFYKLELDDDDEVEIEGRHADGIKFKAEFSRSGRLIEMKND